MKTEEMYHSTVHHIRLLPAWFSPGDEFADSGATDELGQKCNQMGMSAPDTWHKEKPKLFHKSTQKYYYTSKKIALQFFWYFWAMTGKKQFDISQRDLVINFFTLPIVHICRSVGAVFCIASAASGSSSSRAMNAFCICWKKKIMDLFCRCSSFLSSATSRTKLLGEIKLGIISSKVGKISSMRCISLEESLSNYPICRIPKICV